MTDIITLLCTDSVSAKVFQLYGSENDVFQLCFCFLSLSLLGFKGADIASLLFLFELAGVGYNASLELTQLCFPADEFFVKKKEIKKSQNAI